MLTLLLVIGLLLSAFFLFIFIVGENSRFHPSTWRFIRESGLHLRTLHGYIYMRWTQKYANVLFGLTGGSPTSTKGEYWLAERYHAKVLTHELAGSIVTLNRPIEHRTLDQIVPYPLARDIVLQAPPEIVVYECVCRNRREKHCEPTQVCMVVGQPFVDMVLEHHPDKSHRISRDEALSLLEAEHLRGHVHTAWFKDAMLGRFYAICNCCKCCCGGIHEMDRGVPIVASSGFVPKIDLTLCAQCGDCVEACPFRAMAQHDDVVVHDWGRCLGCGVCEVKCAVGAITMVQDTRKGIPLDVRTLA